MKTIEEIEYTVNKTMQASEPALVYFEQPDLGMVKVEIEKAGWYSIFKNEFQSKDTGFHFKVCKPDPFFCLFFQIKGDTRFTGQQSLTVPEQHHSFSFLSSFESQYSIEKHTHLQNLSIKLNPEAMSAKLIEEDLFDSSWQKLVEEKQPCVMLQTTKKMEPMIWDTLFQLLHCPYTGAVGRMYKELLVRMLFLHQVMSFRQQENKAVPDNKLQKRDIEVLHAIKLYLEQHYLDDLSLDAIVKEFGINTFKLKYGFKKLFGTSVMKFIDDRKMNYAKQLLQESHTEVMDIAEKLGYNHYNNFSAAFKRKFGYSPAFYASYSLFLAHI